MKDSLSNRKKIEKANLKIIFEDGADFDVGDIIIAEFVNWQPFYDLYIIGEEMIITIEIAGVYVKDISVYAGKFFMIIDGIRRSPGIFGKHSCVFHNLEIPYGKFNRRIDFPVPVEPKRCKYKIENGILTLNFPVAKERIIPIEEE